MTGKSQELQNSLTLLASLKECRKGKMNFGGKAMTKEPSRLAKAYRWMNNLNQQNVNLPWRIICKVNIPYKVTCFIWLISKEAVPHKIISWKGGNFMSQMCFFVKNSQKLLRHWFLHCKTTSQLWRLFLNLKGFPWSMTGKVTKALQNWKEAEIQGKSTSRSRIIPASIWWTIWKERNARCFVNVEYSVEQIKLNCILILCFWGN